LTALVAEARDELSESWHRKVLLGGIKPLDVFGSLDDYYKFCAAKDWLQDTAEVLLAHRAKGFSSDAMAAYLELWGVLQAVYVQQDATGTLYCVVREEKRFPFWNCGADWKDIRDLRDRAVGHPSYSDRGEVEGSVSIGRARMSYDRIAFQAYVKGGPSRTETIALGAMIDKYDQVAAAQVKNITAALTTRLDHARQTSPSE
jgi:hypothetical protein